MIDELRAHRNQKHPFSTLIGVSFFAILSGLDSFSGMAQFAEAKLEELSEFFDFPWRCLCTFMGKYLSSPILSIS